MHFFRRLQPINAISFDLDDTLYDNKPVLIKAEQRLLSHLDSLGGNPKLSDGLWWRQLKQHTLQQHPQIADDPTATRLVTLQQGLTQLEIANPEQAAAAAMALFMRWRSEITVSDDVVQLLLDLNQRYRLAVITNGNADVSQFLGQIPFEIALAAGKDGPMKPEPDMFQRCYQHLDIAPAQLLHVGDHPRTDVGGAINAGCQAVLLTPQYGGNVRPAGTVLPTATISSLEQLRQLL